MAIALVVAGSAVAGSRAGRNRRALLVGRRIAPLPLVGVASTLVLVPALVGVAALLGVTALVGVPDLLGVVALVRVARAWVARLGG